MCVCVRVCTCVCMSCVLERSLYVPVLEFAAAADADKAAEEAKKTTTERRLASLLDDIPKSPPSFLQAAPGEYDLPDHGASSPVIASPTDTRMSSRESGIIEGSDIYPQREVPGVSGRASNEDLSADGKGGIRGTRCGGLHEIFPGAVIRGKTALYTPIDGIFLSLSLSLS